MQILAATDFSTRSSRAVRQAGLLAQGRDAELCVLHVVDDDLPKDMITRELREAERTLVEHITAMPELQGVRSRTLAMPGDPFDGILRTASAINADLIVMGAHRRQLLRDIFVGTTIERVIRTGPFPVLMVNHEAQRRYEKAVAAIDLSESSANALRTALDKGLISKTGGILLHAFFAPARGKMFIAGAERTSIDEYVAAERRKAREELTAFTEANNLGRHGLALRLEEGEASEVIARVVNETRADLLIMGTHGRSGLLKALLGSVIEQALRSLNVDILAVPAPRS